MKTFFGAAEENDYEFDSSEDNEDSDSRTVEEQQVGDGFFIRRRGTTETQQIGRAHV